MFLWFCKVLKENSYLRRFTRWNPTSLWFKFRQTCKMPPLTYGGYFCLGPTCKCWAQEVQVAGCWHHWRWCSGWGCWWSTSCLPSLPCRPCPPCRRAFLLLLLLPSQGSQWWHTATIKYISTDSAEGFLEYLGSAQQRCDACSVCKRRPHHL